MSQNFKRIKLKFSKFPTGPICYTCTGIDFPTDLGLLILKKGEIYRTVNTN